MAEIDWNLLGKPVDAVGAYVGGLTSGRQIGQQGLTISALNAYDPANPQPTVNALLRAGNPEAAAAVANIGWTQTQRGSVLKFMAEHGGQPAAQGSTSVPQSTAPNGPQAGGQSPMGFRANALLPSPAPGPAAPATTPQDQPAPDLSQLQTPEQQAHALQTAGLYDQVGLRLAQLPYEQRKAALAAEAPALIAHGLPAEAVNGFDPTDANLNQIHAASAQIRGAFGGQQQAAPTATTAPARPDGLDLTDPHTQSELMGLSLMGVNVGPMVDIGKANMPTAVREGGGMWSPSEQRFIAFAPKDGIGETQNRDGTYSATPVSGYVDAQAVQKATLAAAEAAGKLPYVGPAAQAQAAGQAAGAAPYEIVTINRPDGSTVQMPKSVYLAMQAGSAGGGLIGGPGGGGAPGAGVQTGAPGSGLGVAQSPADKAFADSEAKSLSDRIGTLAGQRESAIQARQLALNTQGFALSHPMNMTTGFKVAGANYLRTLPPQVLSAAGLDPSKIDNLATDAATFNRVTNQTVLGLGKTLLPSRYTERELALTKPIAGQLNTPNEAMMFSAALQAAGNQRLRAQSDFATQYGASNAPKERSAFEQGWATSPEGKRSIFQDPEAWGHVTIHGKPAVVYTPDGKWGAFMPGTPYAYKFKVY
jgi:hypothetical protein